MKKLFALFAFLSLAFAGYAANGDGASDTKSSTQGRTVYICLVTASYGTEVIATLVDGNYNAKVNVASGVDFDYSSESHPTGHMYAIEQGKSSSGMIEGAGYTYGADIYVFSDSDLEYTYVKGTPINL